MSTRIRTRSGSVAQAKRQGAHVEEMQRRRLQLAMVEVLAERGLEETSVGHVCKRAGVSRRTFYELFNDRDECLLAAFDAAIVRVSEPVLAAYRKPARWRDRIREALTALLEGFDAEPDVARMCVVETLKAGGAVAERRAHVLSALVAAVGEGRSESKPPNDPPPLTAQGIVGGALSVVHAHLAFPSGVMNDPGSRDSSLEGNVHRLSELSGSLMAMIVHPYLGSTAARREIDCPTAKTPEANTRTGINPFKDLSIRFTYRTARVLATIAANTGASNRLVADNSGIADEGQMSRLLTRLERAGLIENGGHGRIKGEANAWALTERGEAVHVALAGH